MKTIMKQAAVVVGMLLPAPACVQAQGDLVLVSNHVPAALIVLPANADQDEISAASELAKYVGKCFGANLGIVRENALPNLQGKVRIEIGDTTLGRKHVAVDASTGPDQFVIASDGGEHLFLRGARPKATRFAVYAFLERYCGVRWFMPSDLGEYVPPAQATLEVPRNLKLAEKPSFTDRVYSMGGDRSQRAMDEAWLAHNRMSGPMDCVYPSYHTHASILRPSIYRGTHPEYYPLRDGKRYLPPGDKNTGWSPCFSNPDVVDVFVDYYTDYFVENPQAFGATIVQNDGSGWCECEACKAMDTAPANYLGYPNRSGRTYAFIAKVAARVAEKCPGKVLHAYAYSYTLHPPPFTLPDNVLVSVVCATTSDYDKEFRARERKLAANWRKSATRVGIRDYLYGSGYMVPRVLFPWYAGMFQDFYQDGVHDAFYTEAYPLWGHSGPQLYVLSRLLWNIHTDTEAVLAEFCDKMFGTAAKPMQSYFRLSERLWVAQKGKATKYNTWGSPAQVRIWSQADIDAAAGHFEEAYRLCPDARTRERLDMFAQVFDVLRQNFILNKSFDTIGALHGERMDLAALETATLDACAAYGKLAKTDADMQADPLTRDHILTKRPWVASRAWYFIYPLAAEYRRQGNDAALTNLVARAEKLIGGDEVALGYRCFLLDPATPNLAENGNFEAGTGNVPAGWQFGSWGGKTEYAWETNDVREGRRAVKLIGIEGEELSGSKPALSQSGGVSIPCRDKSVLLIKGYYKTSDASARVVLTYYQAQQEAYMPYHKVEEVQLPDTFGRWLPMYITSRVPEGDGFVKPSFVGTAGSVMLDALEIKALDVPATADEVARRNRPPVATTALLANLKTKLAAKGFALGEAGGVLTATKPEATKYYALASLQASYPGEEEFLEAALIGTTYAAPVATFDLAAGADAVEYQGVKARLLPKGGATTLGRIDVRDLDLTANSVLTVEVEAAGAAGEKITLRALPLIAKDWKLPAFTVGIDKQAVTPDFATYKGTAAMPAGRDVRKVTSILLLGLRVDPHADVWVKSVKLFVAARP